MPKPGRTLTKVYMPEEDLQLLFALADEDMRDVAHEASWLLCKAVRREAAERNVSPYTYDDEEKEG